MRRTEVDRPRLAIAVAAGAVTGALIYGLAIKLGLPALADRLTPAQVQWLRDAFQTHPARVLAGVAVVSGVLALPVLLVFRAVYGPFTPRSTSRRGA